MHAKLVIEIDRHNSRFVNSGSDTHERVLREWVTRELWRCFVYKYCWIF